MDQFKGDREHKKDKYDNMKYQKDSNKHSYYKQPNANHGMNPHHMGHNMGPNMGGLMEHNMGPNMMHHMGPNHPNENIAGQANMGNADHHKKSLFDTCHKHHLYLVQTETIDGQMFEGIIDEYDDDGVTLLVPYGDQDRVDGYGPGPGYGYGFGPGFGPQYGYGYPRRFRRFRRFRFPFFNLRRIFFPFFY
ncbi:hypothetical protein [Piscibacillus halophilus]|uniref:hypothetical protein n=1 Tax=Piscibacillus halophilus TaxID=571933 RepID=UPI00158AE5C0|nr:hypothetical protein [Piscibacillus halophilus]